MSPLNSLRAADTDARSINDPGNIVQTALSALNDGRIAEAIALFDDRFTFEDHALGLEITDKRLLAEYFERVKELTPDALVELVSLGDSDDLVVAEWKLTATQNVVYWRQLRMPIVVRGISSILIENGKITRWSDYYVGARARRASLAASFVDWVET